jgi:site-specific recombinase XerD
LLPRLENRLPKHILSVEEAEAVLAAPDVSSVEGLRDRAILETFYSTGMRRMEVANLKLYDIDRERGTVMIRQGKGKKDRHIPIGERALAWIAKYVDTARPELLGASDDGTVFLDSMGLAFDRVRLTTLVRGYIRKAKVGKTGRMPSVPAHGGDADAGEWRGHSRDSGDAGAREADDDGDVYAGLDQSAEAGLRSHASGRRAGACAGC